MPLAKSNVKSAQTISGHRSLLHTPALGVLEVGGSVCLLWTSPDLSLGICPRGFSCQE